MRKVFVIAVMFAASLFVMSCGSGSQKVEQVVDSTAVDSMAVMPVDSVMVDSTVVQ
jgi:hypothetical protein